MKGKRMRCWDIVIRKETSPITEMRELSQSRGESIGKPYVRSSGHASFQGMRQRTPYDDFEQLGPEVWVGMPLCPCKGKDQGKIDAAKGVRKSLADTLFWSGFAPISKRPAKRAKACIAHKEFMHDELSSSEYDAGSDNDESEDSN